MATGFAGNGITGGTAAALVLAEEVRGRPHPWGEAFAATRLRPVASARAVVRENANVAKHLVVDRFRALPAEALSVFVVPAVWRTARTAPASRRPAPTGR